MLVHISGKLFLHLDSVVLCMPVSSAVLVESKSRRRDWELAGRTDGWVLVNFSGSEELIGQFVQVRVTSAAPNSLRGEVAEVAHAH